MALLSFAVWCMNRGIVLLHYYKAQLFLNKIRKFESSELSSTRHDDNTSM